MNRTFIIGIAITILLIGGLASFFYFNYIKVKNISAINAVPDDAALIFEVKNIHAAWNNFTESEIWKDLKKNEAVNQIQKRINTVDSLISLQNELKILLEENKTVVSFHAQGGQKLSILFLSETSGKLNIQDIANTVSQYYHNSVTKRTFEGKTVFDILDQNKMPLLTLSYSDRLLICSEDGSLVEESLRKLKYKLPNATKGIEQVSAMAEVSSDASVYINYQYFPAFINLFSRPQYFGLFDYVKRFANWSMFSLKISKDVLNFSGVTYTDDSVFQYLDLFKTQSPVEMNMHKMLPKNTAFILQTSYSDYTKFAADLTEYLQVHKKLESYNHFSDSIENLYGIDLGDKFLSQIGNEALIGMLEPISSEYVNNLFGVIKFKEVSNAVSMFSSFENSIQKRGEPDSVQMPLYNGIRIGHLRLGNFLKIFYGETFENITSPYYAVVNNVFVFTNTLNALHIIIDNYTSGNTIGSDELFAKYSEHSAASSNVSLFFSPSRNFMLPASFVNDEMFSLLNRYQNDFRKFEYVTIQYANSNNKAFFTNFNLKYNSSFKDETRLLWTLKLDTTYTLPPAVVYNSATKQNCILVQDINNTIYYIGNNGSILWKSKLSGKIMSEILQVDAQKNGKIYYLFNTDKQVCLIDESGKNLSGYPIRFPGNASTALSLIDLKGDSTYSIFVPLDNSKIIGYSINGKPIQGWNPKTTDEKIVTKISSVRKSGITYLIASTIKSNLTMYSVKGEKVKFIHPITASSKLPVITSQADTNYSFITLADTSGSVWIYSIDSTLEPIMNGVYKLGIKPDYFDAKMDPESKSWYVLAGTKNEFLFFDKPDHKVISQQISDSSFSRPFLNRTNAGNIMIGYADKIQNKLFWYTASGSQYPTFPIEGSSGVFVNSNLMLNGTNYIISGDRNNNLILYKLK